MEFPIEFKKCPQCGCEDTICRLACADEPSVPKGTFTSLEKTFCPIQDPTKIMAPTLKGILVHYDICSNCGLRFCVRAEITSLPVNIQIKNVKR